MERSIVYLVSGPAHLPYLVASAYTLRQHYDGEITVYAWPESYEIAEKICQDERIRATPVLREPTYRGRLHGKRGSNDQFYDKLQVMAQAPGDVNVYLDADTIIAGSLDGLFKAASCGFAMTQFGDWGVAGKTIQKRIKELAANRNVPLDPLMDLLDPCTNGKYPSVNGGVWGCKPCSVMLANWTRWTKECIDLFIADEKVMHLVMAYYWDDTHLVVCDGKYNASPLKHPNIKNPVVIHGHGDCFTRPQKCQAAYDLWWPIYQECLKENIGGMADWIGDIRHKHLNRLQEVQHV